MKKFEYLTLIANIDDDKISILEDEFSYEQDYYGIFEYLGSEGWELVATVVLSSKSIEYLFKRELEEIKELSEDALKIKDILGKAKSEEVSAEIKEIDLVQKSKDIEDSIISFNFGSLGYSLGALAGNSFVSIYKDICKKEMTGIFTKIEVDVVIKKRIDMSLLIRSNSILIILSSFERTNTFWDLKDTETYEVIGEFDINVITDIIENKF